MREALHRAEQLPDGGVTAADMQRNLAGYLAAAGESSEAITAARSVIEFYAEREPESLSAAVALGHLASALALGGDLTRAARLAGYADASWRTYRFEGEYTERVTRERLWKLLESGLPEAELHALTAAGALLSAQDAIADALSQAFLDVGP